MPKLPFGDIGPCEVTWDYEDTNLIITPYLGKVSLRMADAVTDVHIDGQGVAPIESFFEGSTVEFEVPMARSTLGQLAETIGYASMGTLVGVVLTLKNVAGIEMNANAKQIVIKPLCNDIPDPDPHTWTLLYKCHPYRDFELGWDRNGQRVHMVKFKVYPSQEEGGGYFQQGIVSWREEFYDDFCDDVIGPEWTEQNTDADRTFLESECELTVGIDQVRAYLSTKAIRAPMLYCSYPSGAVGTPIRVTAKLNPYTIVTDTQVGLFIGSSKYIDDKLWIKFDNGRVEPNDGETIRDGAGLQGDWQSDDYYITLGSWVGNDAEGYACLKNKTSNYWAGVSDWCYGSEHAHDLPLFRGHNDTLVEHAHIWALGMRYHFPAAVPDHKIQLVRNNSVYDQVSDLALPRWLQIQVDAAGVVTFWYDSDGISPYTQYLHGGNPFSINLSDIKGYDAGSSTLGLVIGLLAYQNSLLQTLSAPFESFLIENYS